MLLIYDGCCAFCTKAATIFFLSFFLNNNPSTFSPWRGNRCKPAASRSDNRDNLAAVTNRLYFGSPWASIGLLVNGPSMINVKICLRKWGAVIRTGQSHSGSSPPRVSQPWNPSWNALHLEGKKRQFLIVFKKDGVRALSARPAWRRAGALTGPSLSSARSPVPYFSRAITADELHFTNSYFMEMVGADNDNNNDY